MLTTFRATRFIFSILAVFSSPVTAKRRQQRTLRGMLNASDAEAQEGVEGERLPLIPYPADVKRLAGTQFSLSGRPVVFDLGEGIKESDFVVQSLREHLGVPTTGDEDSEADAASAGKIILQLSDNTPVESHEGYELKVDQDAVNLQAKDMAGLFYGAQTLRQLASGAGGRESGLPGVVIRDEPQLSWRGLHLDVSRHFFNAADVKQLLDTMAAFKLNRFHWHLTDDQGWRFPVEDYPKLTQIGAESVTDATESYTKEDIKDVIAHAQKLMIQVVPEIDAPGHTIAAIAAYPELGNTDISGWEAPTRPTTKFGAMEYTLNPGEKSMSFLSSVFEDVSRTFPYSYVHIGGDEASKAQWQRSKFAGEHLSSFMEVQSTFTDHISRVLKQEKKVPVVWDEAQHLGGLSDDAVIMAWRSTNEMDIALRAGRPVVNSNMETYYFDHYQGPESSEPHAICCSTPLQEVYEYDPVPSYARDDPKMRKLLLGAQGQLWSEYFPTWKHVEYMAHPRSIALAERAWTPAANVDSFDEFKERLAKRLVDLDNMKVNYRRL
eukprot:TRINITY_DN11972_c0_g2_i2.p1 TRINITY_DN11972_c0_g2~~TRINITY_DN11972_c0_g2_i2.p1  ORF type:complete len:549 (-),score=96.95 TRINITY_DN11972_c0_g2_i2:70-1716(-)